MLVREAKVADVDTLIAMGRRFLDASPFAPHNEGMVDRSEEHTSELQSH